MSDIFAPGAAFIIYIAIASSNGQTLDVTSAFTALSLIASLVAPMRSIVFATPPLIAAVGCFHRIETILSLPTKNDHRMLLSYASVESGDTARPLTSLGHTSNDSEIGLQELAPRRRPTITPSILRMYNLTLAWSVDEIPALTDISCETEPGLTMILGPAGSGKLSFVQGILGETPSSKEQVYIDQPHAGDVAQAPWIQNTTIQRNIIGFSPFEPDWYASVIQACAVDYSREKILILYDVFSGRDVINEGRIFTRLLSKTGLLNRLGTTVVLVTHRAHRLSYANHIIALSADGTVAEQGCFETLMKGAGYVSKLVVRHNIEKDDTARSESAKGKLAEKDTELENAATDLQRPVGNWAVYHYYFSSVGLPTGLL